MISPEAIIKPNEARLVELIPSWVTASRGVDLQLGDRVAEVIEKAASLRRENADGRRVRLDLENQNDASDVLHALCRLLMEDCLESPRSVYGQAISTVELLGASRWVLDDLEEREGLICSFIFVAWRAARVLDDPREAQRWECEYSRRFRGSLSYEVVEAGWESARRSSEAVAEMLTTGPEAVLQALLYLKDHQEEDPEFVAKSAIWIYRFIELGRLRLSEDFRSFFLGECARLAGTALRLVANPAEVEHWAKLAETHFRADYNPNPALARVTLLRMALSYDQSRWDSVEKTGPELDRLFADFGMEEDRVKSRIAWAASLKLMGRLQEALEILNLTRQSKDQIRPALYGFVLQQSGDIHQLCGNYQLALEELIESANLLRAERQLAGLAGIDAMIAGIFRSHGSLNEALQLLKSSCEKYARLGMRSFEAISRMLIAETYLAMGRAREAEFEIRTILPVLQEHALVAETVIAFNLLEEAIRRREIERKTPTEIREHLQPKN